MTFAMILDVLVVLLLVPTIIFAVILNGRLSALRKNREELGRLIAAFNDATVRAEAGIPRLKRTSEEASKALQEKVEKAQMLRDDLAFMIERADQRRFVMRKKVRASSREGMAAKRHGRTWPRLWLRCRMAWILKALPPLLNVPPKKPYGLRRRLKWASVNGPLASAVPKTGRVQKNWPPGGQSLLRRSVLLLRGPMFRRVPKIPVMTMACRQPRRGLRRSVVPLTLLLAAPNTRWPNGF
jgi:hypothetical protein